MDIVVHSGLLRKKPNATAIASPMNGRKVKNAMKEAAPLPCR